MDTNLKYTGFEQNMLNFFDGRIVFMNTHIKNPCAAGQRTCSMAKNL